MKNKYIVILEIIIIIAALSYYTFAVLVPEYKEKIGSSDRIVNQKKVKNFIEIKINDRVDFAIALTENGNINHLFFFDSSSVFLYNKNIENKTINDGLSILIPILIENDLLKNGDKIDIYKDNDHYYKEFTSTWNNLLLKYSIKTDTFEKVNRINDKLLEVGVESLLELDFYSKEIVRNNPIEEKIILDDANSLKYANEVYKRIELMVIEKNIKNMNKDEVELDISLIPGEESHTYYPSTNSWYYIKESKVYAYIEFISNNNKYNYCYNGSIDNYERGECTHE